MPAKHVRFAADIAVHAHSSPAYSSASSSLPSVSDSDGPVTPPSLQHDTSPYSRSPLPNVGASPNQRLALPGRNGSPLFISHDFTFDPATSVARLPFTALAEPASYPPTPYIVILHKRLPWQIRLAPSDPKLGYITVWDVLCGVSNFLKQPASKTEYDLIPSDRAKSEVSSAYMRRCKASRNFEAERAAGLKRVDFLEGRTRFCGLTGTSKGPEVWEVHTTT